MPDAFVTGLAAEGSLYQAPGRLEPVLALPLGAELFDLKIEAPLGAGVLGCWVRVSPHNLFRMIPETDANIRLSLMRRTGRIRGSFIDTATGRRHYLEGVVNQHRQSLGGYFKTRAQPGEFGMSPLLQ